MKQRSDGFLKEYFNNPEHEEVADYIRELHNYLWSFVRAELPGAGGNLKDYVDTAISYSKNRNYTKRQPYE